MDLIERLIAKFTRFNYWLLIIPMLAMLMMMLLDGVNVVSIRVFGVRAVPGHKELIEEMLIIVVYMGLAYVLLERGHIKTDFIKNRLSSGLRFASTLMSGAVSVLVSGFITVVSGIGLVWTISHNSAKMGDVQFPLTPFYLIVTLSFVLLLIGSILYLIRDIKRGKVE